MSRGGLKLAAALDAFAIDPAGRLCADLGCNVGGFTDCLLQRGARCVIAVDTGYGTLDYSLRRDERVIVRERTNALHFTWPEPVELVTIDVAWTRQRHIVPAALRWLAPGGRIVSLIKPHYEAPREWLHGGVLDPDAAQRVWDGLRDELERSGVVVRQWIASPLTGDAGNREYLAWIEPAPPSA